MAIMRSGPKKQKSINFPPEFEPLSPVTDSQCATNKERAMPTPVLHNSWTAHYMIISERGISMKEASLRGDLEM